MEKNNHDLDQNKKRAVNEEEYEISSTGYGLESVSNDSDEDPKTENKNSTCGGL
ncbi:MULTISPECIES: hypothetical protein [Bacillus]|uniref:Uncharacterized protein n=1 Tax=Bacillus capparidis TaxID=1840411 RepID=A0ABS4CRP7_9BACI|nr:MULTISPECIES: hypothetical protein [Bacillus]MBP1080252.1 hypothetical protein [Bacillus capparidis]MED1094119.1 hypothetical protein [Bacillus capparidis]